MSEHIEVVETEEQAAARIRITRARKALQSAPMLAYSLRWDAIPLSGRTEVGELPELRTPLITAVVDAADELYVHLHGWSAYFGGKLEIASPAPWMSRRSDGEPRGFRAETTPEDAHNLVSSVASWLLWHETDLTPIEHAADYLDAIATHIWALRAAAGLITPRKRNPIIEGFATRPCPKCERLEVRVEFFGEPMAYAEGTSGARLDTTPHSRAETQDDIVNELMEAIRGVKVRCAHCGWTADARPSQIARWLA